MRGSATAPALTLVLWLVAAGWAGCIVTRDESLWKMRDSGPDARANGRGDHGVADGPPARDLTVAESWQRVNHSVTTDHLNAAWGASDSDVWVVGDKGVILRFNGNTWAKVSAPTGSNIKAIWGSSANDIWAVGKDGVILRYQGSSWVQVSSPTILELSSIWGSSVNDIWAVGKDKVLHYDGGNWTLQPLPNPPNPDKPWDLKGVWGLAANNVWVVGHDGAIFHFNGTSWTVQPSPVGDNLKAVRGRWGQEVWVVGDKGVQIFTTGAAWSRHSPTLTKLNLKALWAHAGQMWAAGGVKEGGNVILHHDGSAWRAIEAPGSAELRGVWGFASGSVWVVGKDGTLIRGPP